MDFLNQFQFNNAMHAVSQGLLIPTVICLLLLIVYSIYTIGSFVVEFVVERRHYRVEVPKLIAKLQEAPYGDLKGVIGGSGLLGSQRQRLCELVDYLYLPEDSRVEVAKRLLADESGVYQKELERTDSASKVGPMLGLMGTLIPLGPGLIALSSGDLDTLGTSLLVAFDTTVAGLTVAVVCFLVSKVRRRWYGDYLVSMESAMNTILEKGERLHTEGFEFDGPRSGVRGESFETMPKEYVKAPALKPKREQAALHAIKEADHGKA